MYVWRYIRIHISIWGFVSLFTLLCLIYYLLLLLHLLLLLLLLLLLSFSLWRSLKVFHWSPSDSKSSQVFRTLLTILGNLTNAVALMVSIRFLIFNFSRFLTKPLGTVLSSPIAFGITVTLMLHSVFVLWQGPNTYLIFHSLLGR